MDQSTIPENYAIRHSALNKSEPASRISRGRPNPIMFWWRMALRALEWQPVPETDDEILVVLLANDWR